MNLNMDVFTLRILIDGDAPQDVKDAAKGILIDAGKLLQAQSNLLGGNKLEVSMFHHPAYETATEIPLDDPCEDEAPGDEIPTDESEA